MVRLCEMEKTEIVLKEVERRYLYAVPGVVGHNVSLSRGLDLELFVRPFGFYDLSLAGAVFTMFGGNMIGRQACVVMSRLALVRRHGRGGGLHGGSVARDVKSG